MKNNGRRVPFYSFRNGDDLEKGPWKQEDGKGRRMKGKRGREMGNSKVF